jgi:hypothetical protein
MASSFVPVAYGIDDVTLGFDMEGSGSIDRLNTMPGTQMRRGKMLGEPASWGRWSHLLGRSVAFWKADTRRLYVQAKLVDEGELCPPERFRDGVASLQTRMSVVGLVSYEEPWVTRLDVAVDADCHPADGKTLLDALEAARLPNGWRTTSSGTPRSTVYFRGRRTEKVLARAYCRNLKTKIGEAFGRIRLEVEERFDPRACSVERVSDPQFPAAVWRSRYGVAESTVTRLAREVQVVEIAERVTCGQLTYAQGERLSMLLDLERLGLAERYYPKSVYAARKREARKLGYASSDQGASSLSVDLAELLRPYLEAVDYLSARPSEGLPPIPDEREVGSERRRQET